MFILSNTSENEFVDIFPVTGDNFGDNSFQLILSEENDFALSDFSVCFEPPLREGEIKIQN